MKQPKGALLLLSALLLFATGKAEAATTKAIPPDSYTLIENRAYVPLRSLFSVLGESTVQWEQSRQTATVSHGEISYAFPIGSSEITVEGHSYSLQDIYLLGGTTYLPLRATAELLGYETTWHSNEEPITLTSRAMDYTEEDFYWLSRIISAESQGEPLNGQIAVGNVVLNRVEDTFFPSTIKDVIFDTKYAVQFEPVSVGSIYWEPTEKSILAARLVLQGAETVKKALYFYAPALSEGTWITQNRPYLTTIGCHKFYL